MSAKLFLLYLAAWSLAALIPGPAVLCSMAQSTRYGFRASLAGISGIQSGTFAFFACIALGLGALLSAATVAFSILRLVGALYLFYLGGRMILATFRRRPAPPGVARRVPRNLFLQGLLIQLTNPKALLFVSALLPQFIEPGRALIPQLLILLAATVAVDVVVLSAYAFLARRGMESFRASRAKAWLERAVGAMLVFSGFRLLLTRR